MFNISDRLDNIKSHFHFKFRGYIIVLFKLLPSGFVFIFVFVFNEAARNVNKPRFVAYIITPLDHTAQELNSSHFCFTLPKKSCHYSHY